ncbi:MAG: hypothetical protein OEO21_01895 [Candidatus Krumholzibacteria bacterium]|nr:hypothetical protein [Candidatus Krumholzibacteria bacterium]
MPELPDIVDAAARARPVVFERDRPPLWNQRSILQGHYKLTVVAYSDTLQLDDETKTKYRGVNIVPGIYLYDLAADPGERTNLYSDNDEHARALFVNLVEQFTGENRPRRPVKIEESLSKKLRSLGYIH